MKRGYRGFTGVLVLTGSLIALQGCAHSSAERRLDDKLSHEMALESRQQLGSETETLIETAPGLTDSQRQRLLSLRESLRAQSGRMREESLKLRLVLAKALVSQDYDAGEVELIK